jgi:hypothetical protein
VRGGQRLFQRGSNCVGVALGGVYAVALLMLRRATSKRHISLGPFMITGTFLTIVGGTL